MSNSISPISSSDNSPYSTPHSSIPPSPTFSDLSINEDPGIKHVPGSTKNNIDGVQNPIDQAKHLKAQANKAFTNNDFSLAAEFYTQAIAYNPIDATLFCNRAYARMKLEEFGYALADTEKAIELDPKYVKAYYRRALCYLQTLRPALAIPDFKKILALDPSNKLAKAQLDTTVKLIRKADFEKAIEMEEEKDAVMRCREIIAEGGCQVESTYTGPHLTLDPESETYSITQQFVLDMIEHFKSGKNLSKRYVWEIILGAYEYFWREESLVELSVGEGECVDVVGDVHGQFYDVLHLYALTGPPSEKHCILMNGDLVDRGSWSVEVILLALAYKWLYPTKMYINRGNHEAKDMNRSYGFEGEAKHKHGEQTYKLFAHVFTALPLATLITSTLLPSPSSKPKYISHLNTPPTPTPTLPPLPNPILSPTGTKRYFVVHGGLFSKDDVTLDDIRHVKRFGNQPGSEGVMCELLWTDPQELPGRGPSKRGVGISFGPDVTRRWCVANKVTGVFRSHEVRQEGYAIEHDGLCTTVFSAPNYVDQSGNKGAFVRINASGDCEYHQFDASPHPPLKPMAYAMGGLASMMM